MEILVELVGITIILTILSIYIDAVKDIVNFIRIKKGDKNMTKREFFIATGVVIIMTLGLCFIATMNAQYQDKHYVEER